MTEPSEQATEYPTPEQDAADAAKAKMVEEMLEEEERAYWAEAEAADAAEAKMVEEMLEEEERAYWDEAEAADDRMRLGKIDG